MSNKKIDINPDLFNIGGSSKTRKKREKKQKPTNVPLISPSVLKILLFLFSIFLFSIWNLKKMMNQILKQQ